MKETEIPAGVQLELFWVVCDVPMIVGQFINTRNKIVVCAKNTHFGEVAHMNYIK